MIRFPSFSAAQWLLCATAIGGCSILTDVDDILCPDSDPNCASDTDPVDSTGGSEASGGDGGSDQTTGGSEAGGATTGPGGASSGGNGTGGEEPTDPCQTGFANPDRSVCCDPGCGTCGGQNCGSDPLGPESCCANAIIDNRESCDLVNAPCHLLSDRCPAPGELTLEYQNGEEDPTVDRVRPHFQIFNQSSQDVDYEHLSIRYYFTEDQGEVNDYTCTVAFGLTGTASCTPLVTGEVAIDSTRENTNRILTLSFEDSDRTLTATTRSDEFKGFIDLGAPADQTNDYSFSLDAAHTGDNYGEWDNVTLYCDGILMDGQPPPEL